MKQDPLDYKYFPDNWVVLKILTPSGPLYKVLAGWTNSYTTYDSWKINSGITAVTKVDDTFIFKGVSGSLYHCKENAYKLDSITTDVWKALQAVGDIKVEVLPSDTNWEDIEYA